MPIEIVTILLTEELFTSSLVLVVSLSVLALGYVVYYTKFHPLAKIPGPFLAKITNLYSVYHAWKGDRHLEFWRCHEKYGPVFRFGPDSVSFNTNTALKTIYDRNHNIRKSKFYSVFPPTKDTFNTHSSIDKKTHSEKRHVLSQAFSDKALRDMEKYVLANVREFCSKLGAKPPATEKPSEESGWSVVHNIADWCNYLTFDIMGDLCFAKAFGMLEHEENRHVIDLIGSAARMHLILGTSPIIKKLGLDKILFRKIHKMRMAYMAYSKAQSIERTKLASVADRRDFFHYLLEARHKNSGQGFTDTELWGESNLLIIAGSDTTSTALASAFFYLVHNPVALEKLTKEVRSSFRNVEEITMHDDLGPKSYLRAVLDEAMRLSPPVGGILPREVCNGGIEIDGLYIPDGTDVGVPHYAIHHNERYFPSPFEFRPERWILGAQWPVPGYPSGPTTASVSHARSALCTFSRGPRGCIGKNLAYMELEVALARTVFMYDMRLAEGTPAGERNEALGLGREKKVEYQLQDCFTSKKNGPMMQFRPKKCWEKECEDPKCWEKRCRDKKCSENCLASVFAHHGQCDVPEPGDYTPYCVCRSAIRGGKRNRCANFDCPIKWFHLECVGLARVDRSWYCRHCRGETDGGPMT
ncbi:hypothetical protein LZ554_008639 [Drepanopeziza brunnea f. sp. 'monogermtubi']|nr:hypothetical protein LZ554_008639 [Drepanopeziza brunnea f. sp. 'monogermtubi']